jgi:hypothetical protein
MPVIIFYCTVYSRQSNENSPFTIAFVPGAKNHDEDERTSGKDHDDKITTLNAWWD